MLASILSGPLGAFLAALVLFVLNGLVTGALRYPGEPDTFPGQLRAFLSFVSWLRYSDSPGTYHVPGTPQPEPVKQMVIAGGEVTFGGPDSAKTLRQSPPAPPPTGATLALICAGLSCLLLAACAFLPGCTTALNQQREAEAYVNVAYLEGKGATGDGLATAKACQAAARAAESQASEAPEQGSSASANALKSMRTICAPFKKAADAWLLAHPLTDGGTVGGDL